MNRDKMAIRYAARLTCLHDWALGSMDRRPEDMGRPQCLMAISDMGRILINEKHTDRGVALDRLWSQISREFPGVGNKDVEEAEKWILPEFIRVYDMQRREIEAVQILTGKYSQEGEDLNGIAARNGIYKWEFYGWMDFSNRIQWLFVLAIESLERQRKDYTIDDIFKERDRLREELNTR